MPKPMNSLRNWLLIAVAVSPLVALRAQTSLPISVTGYNDDLILGVGEGTPYYGTAINGYIYYAAGASLSGESLTEGLPDNGLITSAANSNVQFQLASYTGNNVVNGSGTLTLSTPASYQSVSFLATSFLDSTLTATLHFSDGTSLMAGPYTVLDWTNNSSPAALSNMGLASTTGGSAYDGIHYYEYDFAIPTADQSLILDSIDISGTTGATQLFAVSGEMSAVPEPATYATIFGAVALGVAVWRRRPLTSSTGNS